METNIAEAELSDRAAIIERVKKVCQLSGLVLLRPHDLEMLADFGDFDFLGDLNEAGEAGLVEEFGKPMVLIRRQYVQQRYYQWGQLDVLPVLEWNGFAYADHERVTRESIIDDAGLRRPRVGDDAVISWLTSLLWGGFFKEKYSQIIEKGAAHDGPAMGEALIWALGTTWGNRLMTWVHEGRCAESAKNVVEIRRALRLASLKREPGKTLAEVLSHWGREIVIHFKPPMPMIAFLGPDGSGKSTILSGVKNALKNRRISVVDLHWRPGVLMKGGEPDGGIVTDPHGKPPRGKIASILKLGLLVVDWHLGYWFRLRHSLAKGSVVISDRFYDDLLIDPQRYRYGGGKALARLFFRFAPKPDLIFVLAAPAEVIFQRKQEVTFEVLQRQIKDYERYAKFNEGRGSQKKKFLVMVDRPIEEIVCEVIDRIENWQCNQTK